MRPLSKIASVFLDPSFSTYALCIYPAENVPGRVTLNKVLEFSSRNALDILRIVFKGKE
jgi:hypothetical protein